jgi:acid phosphatase type 7
MRFFLILCILLPCLAFSLTGEMLPYLQTPTSTSMYVCWKAATGTASTVQYGTSAALGSTTTGGFHSFSTDLKWHWVKLLNLIPNTRYYYKCVTGSQVSAVNSFTTAPAPGSAAGHLRLILMGDTRTNTSDVVNLVTGIQAKLLELYGVDWRQKINLLCHVGDVVNSPTDPIDLFDEFFIPFSPLSSSIPIMVTAGNHEVESANFYDFMKTEELAGPEGKKYYSFDLADARFIFINSNTKGTTQENWILSQVSTAGTSPNLDFVFGILHHFGHSEFSPSQNNSWVQNTVIPAFGTITKPGLLSYGHAHCYERGTHPTNRTRLVLNGAGGAPMEEWNTTSGQLDYPETHVALDYWMYVIIDIDLATHKYEAKMFTLGNDTVPLANVQKDSWSQSVSPVLYKSVASSTTVFPNGEIELVSTPLISYLDFNLMSSQMQVSKTTAFTINQADVTRNWLDIYRNSGTPDYIPTNWNTGIDLKQYTLANSVLQSGLTYFWRVRYRSQNTDWGEWSASRQFVNLPNSALATPVVTTLVSSGSVTLHWQTISGATSYNVYTSSEPDGPFTLTDSSVVTTWTATNTTQTKMFYRVTAEN